MLTTPDESSQQEEVFGSRSLYLQHAELPEPGSGYSAWKSLLTHDISMLQPLHDQIVALNKSNGIANDTTYDEIRSVAGQRSQHIHNIASYLFEFAQRKKGHPKVHVRRFLEDCFRGTTSTNPDEDMDDILEDFDNLVLLYAFRRNEFNERTLPPGNHCTFDQWNTTRWESSRVLNPGKKKE